MLPRDYYKIFENLFPNLAKECVDYRLNPNGRGIVIRRNGERVKSRIVFVYISDREWSLSATYL